MGASASIQQPPPYETVEAALMAGITQDEIDAWYALHGGNERTMTTCDSEEDDQHLKNSRNMSSKSSNNKVQKTDHESGGGGGGGSASTTPLVKTLLKENGVIRKIVEITSVSQTLRLLMTCKELHAVEKDVFEKHKLPVVCNMQRGDEDSPEGNEFKLYRAMVETPNSRWVKWLDTSEVEELKLPDSVTDEEMLIMFDAAGGLSFDGGGGGGGGGGGKGGGEGEGEGERGKRFSKLRTLGLVLCRNITDASVLEVARRCSNLQTLNLSYCRNITDASVLEVARRCSNLQRLILLGCSNITSACKNTLRQSHPKLQLEYWN